MPQLARLCLLAPVLTEEPAHQLQVFDVMLPTLVGEIAIKVGRGLGTMGVLVQVSDVNVKFRCNCSQMGIGHVDAIAKALNCCLEVTIFERV